MSRFASWIKTVEEKHPIFVVKGEQFNFKPHPNAGSVENISKSKTLFRLLGKACVNGTYDTGEINSAFTWSSTPQGHRYWSQANKNPGCPDAVWILQTWAWELGVWEPTVEEEGGIYPSPHDEEQEPESYTIEMDLPW